MYAICVMSQSPENVTLLLSNRCHVMLAEQRTTFGCQVGLSSSAWFMDL